jgi:hypothetical protein
MFEHYDLSDTSSIAAARIREMTRVTSVGDKVNVHVIQANAEPKPDFEAMRRLVAEPKKEGKAATKDDNTGT